MILTIDNLAGAGAVDYSAVLCADHPLKIERVLNAPSRCSGMLAAGSPADPGAGPALPVPVRRARVVVAADSGAILFTGYLATEPVPVYAGVGLAGPVYRVAFSAISDEWLLDKQTATLTGAGFAVPAGTLLATLTNRIAAGLLTAAGGSIGLEGGESDLTLPEQTRPVSPAQPSPRIACSRARSASIPSARSPTRWTSTPGRATARSRWPRCRRRWSRSWPTTSP